MGAYIEGDPVVEREEPEPIRATTVADPPAERVPVGARPEEPAPTLHVDEGEHFEIPIAGFLGEDGRLATESSTVKTETFTFANNADDVLVIPRQPVDCEIPLTVEGEGTTVRVATVQQPDEHRLIEKEVD